MTSYQKLMFAAMTPVQQRHYLEQRKLNAELKAELKRLHRLEKGLGL